MLELLCTVKVQIRPENRLELEHLSHNHPKCGSILDNSMLLYRLNKLETARHSITTVLHECWRWKHRSALSSSSNSEAASVFVFSQAWCMYLFIMHHLTFLFGRFIFSVYFNSCEEWENESMSWSSFKLSYWVKILIVQFRERADTVIKLICVTAILLNLRSGIFHVRHLTNEVY